MGIPVIVWILYVTSRYLILYFGFVIWCLLLFLINFMVVWIEVNYQLGTWSNDYLENPLPGDFVFAVGFKRKPLLIKVCIIFNTETLPFEVNHCWFCIIKRKAQWFMDTISFNSQTGFRLHNLTERGHQKSIKLQLLRSFEAWFHHKNKMSARFDA